MSNKKLISISIAFFALTLSDGLSAKSSNSGAYCYAPCKSTLFGHIQIKSVALDDPELRFTAYVLVLDKPISMPENGQYIEASGEDHVQLEFMKNKRDFPPGSCLTVVGGLTGAITATDIYDLVMQVDSYSQCK